MGGILAMSKLVVFAALTLVAATISGSTYANEQQILDPAVHNLTRLDTLELGKETDSSHMAPKEYWLKVGQGYRWKIEAAPRR